MIFLNRSNVANSNILLCLNLNHQQCHTPPSSHRITACMLINNQFHYMQFNFNEKTKNYAIFVSKFLFFPESILWISFPYLSLRVLLLHRLYFGLIWLWCCCFFLSFFFCLHRFLRIFFFINIRSAHY